MIRKWLVVGFSSALLGLAACDREDKSPTSPDPKAAMGSARIALPKLPAGYVDSGQQALFALTISGSGMVPIQKSWYLSPDHSEPIVVGGIPVGVRSFYGRLIRLDAGDTTVTHEGTDSAYIQRDTTAEVHLFLRAAGLGSVHVCVEVEGWPADPTCIVPPPMPWVAGCYDLTVSNFSPTGDSLYRASLRIDQMDSVLFGFIDWKSGGHDTSAGRLFPGPAAYFGYEQPGDFQFKSMVDSNGFLQGPFFERKMGIEGFARGIRASCVPETLPPPPPPRVPKVEGCYALSVLKSGPQEDTIFNGKLRLFQKDTAVVAEIVWSPLAKDTSSGIVHVYPDGKAVVYVSQGKFTLKGMFDSAQGLSNINFYSASRGIDGEGVAPPAACDSPVPPNETVRFDSVECWQVAQKTADGRAMKGTLWAAWKGASLVGWFKWDGYPGFAMDNGTAPVGTSTLYLFGNLPGGFAHPERSVIERGHYKAKLAAGQLDTGAAYARAGANDFTSADKFADWTGSAYACTDQAHLTLAKLRKN
jgi:hypothetical protein